MSIEPEVLEPVLQKRIDRLNRTATDRAYMLEALAQMLGPKARQVWASWQAQGVQRIHSDWVIDPMSMDGEDVAQIHLDMEEAMKSAVVVEDIDAHIAQCRFDTPTNHAAMRVNSNGER